MNRPTQGSALIFFHFLFALVSAQEVPRCQESLITVSVIDQHNVTVPNLSASDFRISFHGGTPRVTSLEYRQHPDTRVVVLLDTSGSMRGDSHSDKWKFAHEVTSAFVSWAPAQEQISLITFSTEVQRRFVASDGRRAIQEWLSSSNVKSGEIVKGRTAMLDAIRMAIKELSPPRTGDSIYIISDGGDNGDKESLSRIERNLTNSGIRVFAYRVGQDKYESALEVRIAPSGLSEIVQESGGLGASYGADLRLPETMRNDFRLDPEALASVEAVTVGIQKQITSFYTLRVDGVDSAHRKKEWNIEVVDGKGRKRKDILVAYPHRPPLCAEELAQSP